MASAGEWQLVESRKDRRRRAFGEKQATSSTLSRRTDQSANPLAPAVVRYDHYAFPPPLKLQEVDPAHDAIAAAALVELNEDNISSFSKFASPLKIHEYANGNGGMLLPVTEPRYFALTRDGSLFAQVALCVRSPKPGRRLRELVVVVEGSRSMLFSEWLADLPESDMDSITGAHAYELQYQWWCNRGIFCDWQRPPRFREPSFLKHVQLSLSDFDYFVIFNAGLPYLRPEFFDSQRLPIPFHKLPNLKHLELYFRSNIDYSHSTPWWHWYLDEVKPSDSPANHVERFPCRKAVIDYILCFGYEHIKHIRKINLTGYIKDSTRERWMGIFDNPEGRDQFDEQIKGRIAAIKSMPPSKFPPKCFCPHPCGYIDLWEARGREGPYKWWGSDRPEVPDWRREEKIRKALQRYHFDFDDSRKAVERVRIGKKWVQREVKEGDPYAGW